MDNVGRIKECIEMCERHIKYESSEGEHTFSMCVCERQSSRSYKCLLCLNEHLEELKEELMEVEKNVD